MKKRMGMKTKLQIKSKKDWLIALVFFLFSDLSDDASFSGHYQRFPHASDTR